MKDDPKDKTPMRFEEMKKEVEGMFLNNIDWNNKRRKEHNVKDRTNFEQQFRELEQRRKL